MIFNDEDSSQAWVQSLGDIQSNALHNNYNWIGIIIDTVEIRYHRKQTNRQDQELQTLNEYYILRARPILSPDKNLQLIYHKNLQLIYHKN